MKKTILIVVILVLLGGAGYFLVSKNLQDAENLNKPQPLKYQDLEYGLRAEDVCGPQPPAECGRNMSLKCRTADKKWGCYPDQSTSLLEVCPDEWYEDRMPGIIGETNTQREYFIYKGARRELSEFNLTWVKQNCKIEPQVVY